MDRIGQQQQVKIALARVQIPAGIMIRAWSVEDFPAIQRLSDAEGWTSPSRRPADSLGAWRNSWPALVAQKDDVVVGFVRALTDGAITMYIADLLVDQHMRGAGIGRSLLETCHQLYPTTRLDLLAADGSRAFYEACGYRLLHDGMRKSYV
ncbi:GNAT family N-acetyltransferase [Dictyobacter aurantiacus]|uniref:N-acetyltransferase domain-containing protein n=1 Tax=Dictyobacter aurantiacus TaxID=1936993 RepID=A0A401ZDX4_9CHLR|nr:GNAT family N-acetyltransferase [Dictyobacter aurantiacus]GCE05084.1 hypothetical protein KDAU_24130 [Dictyobacter aurantiacus]